MDITDEEQDAAARQELGKVPDPLTESYMVGELCFSLTPKETQAVITCTTTYWIY